MPQKLQLFLGFFYEIYFLLAHFYFKCNEQTIYYKKFSMKISNNLVTRDYKTIKY